MDALPLLRSVCDVLDSLGVAACVLDDQDRTLTWNRSFLRFFPEHGGRIFSGEAYEKNLRRFFGARDAALAPAQLERMIQEALERHRTQNQAFAFEHRGRRLRVGSLPLPGVGRIRIWTEQALARLEGPLDPGRMELGLLDHLPDAVMVTTPDGLIAWVNETFVYAYGLPDRESALGQRFEDLYAQVWTDKPDRHRFGEGAAALAERLRSAGAPIELPLPLNRWVRVVGQPGPEGRGVYAHVDITALKRHEARLVEAERRARESEAALQQKSNLLQVMLERMEQGVMMVNADHVVEVCNARAVELLGLPPAMMAARPRFKEVLEYQWSTDEFRNTPEDLKAFVRAGGILEVPQIYDRVRPDGRVIEVRSVPLEGGGVLRTYTDVSERRRREDSIRHRAERDGLTNLLNRASFRERLATLLPVPDGEGFALHFIDLDHFKPVNDCYGHGVGDRVLVVLAERLRGVARDADVVARLGGDEFAVLQMGVRRADQALGLAHRITAVMAQPMAVDGVTLQVGASVGVALALQADTDAEALLRHADAAMYAAKAAGRDAVRIHGQHQADTPGAASGQA